jgi:hypothetical protein
MYQLDTYMRDNDFLNPIYFLINFNFDSKFLSLV